MIFIDNKGELFLPRVNHRVKRILYHPSGGGHEAVTSSKLVNPDK